MSATTSNTSTTNTDETVVETLFRGTDGELDNGSARTTVRKTGSTYSMAVNYNAVLSLSGSAVTELVEYCEDAIEHFTAVKTALQALAS